MRGRRRLFWRFRWDKLTACGREREGCILVDFTEEEHFWFAGRHCVGRWWMWLVVEME